jgi:hypothetical protein
MANFPTSLDTFPNPTATTKEDAASFYHDVGHSDLGDALEAVEAKVGVTSSTVDTSYDYRMKKLYPLSSAQASEDDDFMDGSFTGWTTVEGGSTTLTVTESNGRCSVVHNGGGTTAYFIARMKAHTFATNDWIETAVQFGGVSQNHNMGGLCMSNGTTWGTSNAFHWLVRTNTTACRRQGNNGFNSDTSNGDYALPLPAAPWTFLRLRYEGSNTFRGYTSPDNVSWIDVTGAQTYTLTPTHIGFSMTSWGGSAKHVMSMAYFKTGNG